MVWKKFNKSVYTKTTPTRQIDVILTEPKHTFKKMWLVRVETTTAKKGVRRPTLTRHFKKKSSADKFIKGYMKKR